MKIESTGDRKHLTICNHKNRQMCKLLLLAKSSLIFSLSLCVREKYCLYYGYLTDFRSMLYTIDGCCIAYFVKTL